MRQLLVLLFVFSQINSAIGQHKDSSFEYLGREFPNGTFSKSNSKVKGSRYINSTFQKIKFLDQEDGKFSGKYNAYHDLIEVITKTGKKYFSPSTAYPYSVVFLGTNKVYRAFSTSTKKSAFFRIVFADKKIALLTKERIILTQEVLPQSGYDTYKPPAFKRLKDVHYLKYSSKDIVEELPKRKSKFFKIFDKNSTAVKNYVKKEKLNTKDEADLIKIFKYASTL